MFHWVDFPSSSMVSWDTPWIFEDFLLVPHRAIPREEAEKDNPKPDAKSKVKAKAKAKAKSSSRRSAGRARFTFQWFKWPNDGWMRLMRQASIHGGKIEASQVSWPDGLYYGLFMFKKTQRNLKTWTPSRSPSQAGKSPGISSHLYGKKHGFPLVKKKHFDADENCSSIPGNQKWYMFIFVHSAQDKHHCLKPVENWEPDGFLNGFSFGWKLNQTIDYLSHVSQISPWTGAGS